MSINQIGYDPRQRNELPAVVVDVTIPENATPDTEVATISAQLRNGFTAIYEGKRKFYVFALSFALGSGATIATYFATKPSEPRFSQTSVLPPIEPQSLPELPSLTLMPKSDVESDVKPQTQSEQPLATAQPNTTPLTPKNKAVITMVKPVTSAVKNSHQDQPNLKEIDEKETEKLQEKPKSDRIVD